MAVGLAVAALAPVAAAGCGGRIGQPIRIGVLVDCTGVIAAEHDWRLPRRAAPARARRQAAPGHGPNGGVRGATVAGRPVQLVEGCTETGVFGRLISEATRLVETEHVDVVVGGVGWSDGFVFRDLARRYPHVAFVLAGSWAREVTASARPRTCTLHPRRRAGSGRARDVCVPDAGLAPGGRRRRGRADGLGVGRRVRARVLRTRREGHTVLTPSFSTGGEPVGRVPASDDGVAVFEDYGIVNPAGFLRAYVRRHPDAARHVLLSTWVYGPADQPQLAGSGRASTAS